MLMLPRKARPATHEHEDIKSEGIPQLVNWVYQDSKTNRKEALYGYALYRRRRG